MALIEIRRPAAQPLVSEDSSFEFESAVDSLKRYNATGNNHSSPDSILEWGETFLSGTHNFNKPILKKVELPKQ
jgi:hypothetical protein